MYWVSDAIWSLNIFCAKWIFIKRHVFPAPIIIHWLLYMHYRQVSYIIKHLSSHSILINYVSYISIQSRHYIYNKYTVIIYRYVIKRIWKELPLWFITTNNPLTLILCPVSTKYNLKTSVLRYVIDSTLVIEKQFTEMHLKPASTTINKHEDH